MSRVVPSQPINVQRRGRFTVTAHPIREDNPSNTSLSIVADGRGCDPPLLARDELSDEGLGKSPTLSPFKVPSGAPGQSSSTLGNQVPKIEKNDRHFTSNVEFRPSVTSRESLLRNIRRHQRAAASMADQFDSVNTEMDQRAAVLHFNHALTLQLGTNVRKPDLKNAIRHYEQAAALSHTKSMINVAMIYLYSDDSLRNYSKGLQMLSRACRHDDVQAMTFYGALLCNGNEELGVPQNSQLGVRLFQRAVKNQTKGSNEALLQLSICYAKGCGVHKNAALAYELCTKAALSGFAPAQHRLGILLALGEGCAANRQSARKWFRRAVKNGHHDSSAFLARLSHSAKSC